MLDRMSDSIQGSRVENLQSREVDRQSPTGLIFCKLCLPWHSVHHSLPTLKNCNNLRDRGHLYEHPDLCPPNSPDLKNSWLQNLRQRIYQTKAQNKNDLRQFEDWYANWRGMEHLTMALTTGGRPPFEPQDILNIYCDNVVKTLTVL